MFEKPLDGDIVARIEARDRATRRMFWVLIAPTVLLVAAFAVLFATGRTEVLQSQGVQIGILFVGCIILFALLKRRQFRPGVYVDISDPRIVRRRIDTHHRALRLFLWIGILASFSNALSYGVSFNRLEHVARFLALGAGGMMILTTALFLAPLMIGPGWFNRGLRDILDDEYMRALRGRAMRLGYRAAIAAVAAALIATLWRPDFALPSLTLALNAGFAIPALYYVVADWRASRYDG
ncbi:MAG: hypothetical protein WDN01_20895 [Rhizomicrobium sp.]